MSHEGDEVARRNGLVWRRKVRSSDALNGLRRFLEEREGVGQTYDQELRRLLSKIRGKLAERTGCRELSQAWSEIKGMHPAGSEAWAIANAALFSEHSLTVTDPDEKLRHAWNAGFEMGKTVGGLALGEHYEIGEKYRPVHAAQKAGPQVKPDTPKAVREIESLMAENPASGRAWASLQVARRNMPNASECEVKEEAERLRKRSEYHAKKVGEK